MLYPHPFEGQRAPVRRGERPAFGDLDDRLLDGWRPTSTALAHAARPRLRPRRRSRGARRRGFRHLQRHRDRSEPRVRAPRARRVRAAGEALPLASASIDVAVCLSSIRHVRDRAAVLRELRRVVRGALVIVELDPEADRGARIAHHAGRLGSRDAAPRVRPARRAHGTAGGRDRRRARPRPGWRVRALGAPIRSSLSTSWSSHDVTAGLRRAAELHGELAAVADSRSIRGGGCSRAAPRCRGARAGATWSPMPSPAPIRSSATALRRPRDPTARCDRPRARRPRRDPRARRQAAGSAARRHDRARASGAIAEPSALDVAAFAIGDRLRGRRPRRSGACATQLADAPRGIAATRLDWHGGDAVRLRDARRRAARDRAPRPSPRVARRPRAWLGLGRAGEHRDGVDLPPGRRRLRPRAAWPAGSSAGRGRDRRAAGARRVVGRPRGHGHVHAHWVPPPLPPVAAMCRSASRGASSPRPPRARCRSRTRSAASCTAPPAGPTRGSRRPSRSRSRPASSTIRSAGGAARRAARSSACGSTAASPEPFERVRRARPRGPRARGRRRRAVRPLLAAARAAPTPLAWKRRAILRRAAALARAASPT